MGGGEDAPEKVHSIYPQVVNMVRESEKKRVTGELEGNIFSFFKRRFEQMS